MYVHSSRIRKQVEHMRSLGIDTADLMKQLGIEERELSDPERQFSFGQYQAVLDYAVRESGDPFYGLHMGKEPSLAGTIGMMCASCRNLRDAFAEGSRLFRIQGNFATVEFIEEKSVSRFIYSLSPEWTMKYPETARHEVDAMMMFLAAIASINSGGIVKPIALKLSCNALESCEEYVNNFGVCPSFKSESDEIHFRSSDLHVPMKAFNPETYLLLRQYIENQIRKFSGEESVSEKVRSILLTSMTYTFPDIGEVAGRLNVSSRTLQRQLSEERTSFQSILQDTRFDLAKQMLRQKQLTISEISYMLGYSDLGNFSRSFKKYTGTSPADYRRNPD